MGDFANEVMDELMLRSSSIGYLSNS